MKRSTKILTTVVLSFGIIGGAMAYGKHRHCDAEKRGEHMIERISSKLSLDDAQTQSLVALKDQVMESRTKVRGDWQMQKEELKTLIEAESFDQARVMEIMQTKSNLFQEEVPLVIAALGNFLDGLTAEQKSEIVEFMNKMPRRKAYMR